LILKGTVTILNKKFLTATRVRLFGTLVVSFLLLTALFAIAPTRILRASAADSTSVDVIPALQEYGPENVTGQEFIIDVYVNNVTDLYGVDILFSWNATYLLCLNHTVHIPVDTYPDGILHSGILIKNELNVTAGTYWLSYASMGTAPFDGSGIAFDMAFRIVMQPEAGEHDVTLGLHLVSADLSDSGGSPIPHSINDGTVTIHAMSFVYPPEPLLKVMPQTITISAGEQFYSDVYIMGEGGVALDPYWDVAGFDIYMHYSRTEAPFTVMEALNVTADPDGTFATFWPGGVWMLASTINNTGGYLKISFLGLPDDSGNHTPPSGNFRVFTVAFNGTYVGSQITANITLQNPKSFVHRMTLDADDGPINLASPADTGWTVIDSYDYGVPYNLYGWTDNDGDSELSVGDEILLNNTNNGMWHRYIVHDLKGTLTMEQQPFAAQDDYLDMDGPTNKYTPWQKLVDTGIPYNGTGVPYWTGNFSCTYPVDSVNYIEVTPQIGAPYNLTEGVDFVVNPDGTIWLKTALDEFVQNESVGLMPVADAGWPALAYIASSIQSVWIEMPNGTQRYAINNGFEQPPPAEWWYEPDYPYELESWWATGYYPGAWTWPNGTEIYVNYTAPAFIHIDYNAVPDLRPYYVEFSGSYADFLALGDPVGTIWNETYPNTLHAWNCTGWIDSDESGDISIGDYLTLNNPKVGDRDYLIDHIATNIVVDEIRTVDNTDINSPFFNMPLIIDLAGFPHPDRAVSPWHNNEGSMAIPHDVENAEVVISEFPAPLVMVLMLAAATTLVLVAKLKTPKSKEQ
jgi:hypothetical protein